MISKRAKRAPFKAARIDEIEPRPEHKFREWQEEGFTKFVVDRHGIVFRMMREGVDIDAMVEELNTNAAMAIMIEGTAADPNMNCDIWTSYNGKGINT